VKQLPQGTETRALPQVVMLASGLAFTRQIPTGNWIAAHPRARRHLFCVKNQRGRSKNNSQQSAFKDS
jgi:hypothetical protein